MRKIIVFVIVLLIILPYRAVLAEEVDPGQGDPSQSDPGQTEVLVEEQEEQIDDTGQIEQEISLETTDTIPMRPLSLRYVSVTPTSVTLTWDDNMGYDAVTSYNVYANGLKVGSTTVSSYTVSDLQPGKMYVFEVTAVNYYGESFASDPVRVITPKQPVEAPKNLRALNITDKTALITWEGEGAYEIYLNDELIGTVNRNEYLIQELEPGKSYRVRVCSAEDSSLYTLLDFTTGQTIDEFSLELIISKGFEYIQGMWPYLAVVLGCALAFALIERFWDAFYRLVG